MSTTDEPKKIFMTRRELNKCNRMTRARKEGDHKPIKYIKNVMKKYKCHRLDYYDEETGEIVQGSGKRLLEEMSKNVNA